MSVRTTQQTATYAEAVQHDLKVCRQTALEANRQENLESSESPQYEGEVAAAYDALAPHEQAAASLGVHPDALRPIGWLNAGHFENLKKAELLSDNLSRRIEAYKKVAEESA